MPARRRHETPDSIALEVDLLDRARAANARGANREALDLLGRHDRDFPASRLGPEALVLRLTALVQLGRASEARALAERYLERQPGGAHAEQIRKITGLGTAPAGPTDPELHGLTLVFHGANR